MTSQAMRELRQCALAKCLPQAQPYLRTRRAWPTRSERQARWLSGEQNIRAALIDSYPRETLIAMIAAHLRKAGPRNKRGLRGSVDSRPCDWYARPM